MPAPALDWLSARRRQLSYPSPAIAWGGCIGDLWSPFLRTRTPMLCIGYDRSDGRVGALAQPEKSRIDDVFFENPHPGSLSLADPPRKGEGDCTCCWRDSLPLKGGGLGWGSFQ